MSWALGDEGESRSLGLQRAGWEVASHPLWGGKCRGAAGRWGWTSRLDVVETLREILQEVWVFFFRETTEDF